MNKTFWLLLGLAPILLGFFDWRGTADWTMPILLTVTAICCLTSAFGIVKGTIPNLIGRVVVSLLLGFLLFALDFALAAYVGCSRHPFRM